MRDQRGSKSASTREHVGQCLSSHSRQVSSSEDYQLQLLMLRSGDQIASQFVRRLFFLAPPSSPSYSTSSFHPLSLSLSPTSLADVHTRSLLLRLPNLVPYCGPRPRIFRSCATESRNNEGREDAAKSAKCHDEFLPNRRNYLVFPS